MEYKPPGEKGEHLNLFLFGDTWGRIWGDRFGLVNTLTSITNEKTGEVVYKADKTQAG